MTAVECLIQELQNNFAKQLQDMYESNQLLFEDVFIKAKEMEKEQSKLYAEFAVLNDRSGNPIIPFNEFINIDNL